MEKETDFESRIVTPEYGREDSDKIGRAHV